MKKISVITTLSLLSVSLLSAATVTFDNASDLNYFVDVRNADNNAHNSTIGADANSGTGFMDITSTNTGSSAAYRAIYDAGQDGVDASDLYGEATYGTAFNFQSGAGYLGLFWAPASGTNDAVSIYLQTDWNGSNERVRAATGVGVDGNTWSNSSTLGFTDDVDADYFADITPTDGSQWNYMQVTSSRTGTTASDTRTLLIEIFDSVDNTGTVLASYSHTYAAGVAVGDGYIGYTKFTDTGNIGVDNFTVIPEPSTFSLMGVALLAVFGLTRRRR